ncbi:MAG: hypothetical protein AAF531_24160 [Actinomycetota bacterium]
MTGLLIAGSCILVFAVSVLIAIAVMSTHGHGLKAIGFFLLPVAPVVVIVLAIVADPGWWLVLVAAVPAIIMMGASLFRDSDGRNILEDMKLVKPKRRA